MSSRRNDDSIKGDAMSRPRRFPVVTIDFHVTSACSQDCPYCWGPSGYERPVDTSSALEIIDRIRHVGARRIVFTGGDPVTRSDIGLLIRHAREIGLEVALSTTGDELTGPFLDASSPHIDLISLPVDGSSEQVNSRTKKPGHFAAIMRALDLLRAYPSVDVKLCTPVTRLNLDDVPNIARLAEAYAQTTKARIFYNIFQAFPRSMGPRRWTDLLVSDREFQALGHQLEGKVDIRVNLLSHQILDRLYVMIFPDGELVIPSGPDYLTYGQFLDAEDLDAVVGSSQFDAQKHRVHALGWGKNETQKKD
jgi:MoaA/NifB/PqqE/SkfB family radical SAM enzyme